LADHLVFVLDDAHLLEDPAIHAALTYLLDHLPPTLHVVLAGRAAPPLPLARYRARDEMLEVRAEALQFWPGETAAFLNRSMGLDLADDAVATLHGQTEGWIAGIQLVALTLRQRLTGTDALVVRGSHRFIADYLNEDVLAPLAAGMRQFLLRTSILDRLCGALCDAVTGTDGGQEMLERLERENVFLAPLDDGREWFRYHPLFADFLRSELRRRHPDDAADLHRRAARWHLAHDLPEPAFRHAVAGEDVELVVHIAERYLAAMLFGGEIRAAQRWLDSLPAAWYASHPELGLAQAAVLLFTGQLDACARRLDEVERRLAPTGRPDRRGWLARVTAIRCLLACYHNDLARAERYADRALRELPDEALSLRADIYHALGDT
jgi:LuxR family maltose regulon positive regulatory protein